MIGTLFLLIGPTGVGKNTLINNLLSQTDQITFLPSYTSRPMRDGESEGNPYYFVSKTQFEDMIKDHELIEWKFVHGNNYYGIGKKKIEEALSAGKNLITDIEVLGAIDVVDCFVKNCVSIFVDLEDTDELLNRIQQRGVTSPEDLKLRLHRVAFEMQYKYHFNYLVHNHDLDECSQHLTEIINLESKLSTYHQTKSDSAILHYAIRPIITNSENQLLLQRKKTPFPNSEWKILNKHVLSNESPKDALLRELHFICPSISKESKDLISTMRPVNEEKHFLGNHFHYEIIFKLKLDLPKIENENDDFAWFSHEKALEILDEDEIRLIDYFN